MGQPPTAPCAALSGLRVLVAPDKFKGSMTAGTASEVMARAAQELGASVRQVPLADGGDGFLDVFGGGNRRSGVQDPLGRTVEVPWRSDAGRAVLEAASACGLALVGGAEANDPWAAHTRGVGELIAAALESGSARVLVGVGGTATTDGGAGALAALHGLLPFAPGRVEVATDVLTPFSEAATVFAQQKGATSRQIPALTRRLRRVADDLRREFGADVWDMPRAGAGGGLAGALAAAGAELVGGAALVAREVGLAHHLEWADLVITGEGRFDATSVDGKAPGLVLEECRARGIPVALVAGEVASAELGHPWTAALVDCVGARIALADPEQSLLRTTSELLARVAPLLDPVSRPCPDEKGLS
jgi:glycerate kinase